MKKKRKKHIDDMWKNACIKYLLDGFHPLDQDELGVVSVPTTDEIRNNNYNKMYSLLISEGYRMTEKMRECSDGTEYEITEIRGPKASGFFIHSHFVRAQTFDCVKR